MAISYRQILLEREGQPLKESQVQLLLRQVLSQLRTYHDQNQAHGGVSLSTIQQVPHGCQLLPPTRTSVTATPQQDIVALAQAAVTLLTGYPPSPNWVWQEHCEINPNLAQVLTQMLAGAFDRAGQVLALLVSEDWEATEFDTVSHSTLSPTVPSPNPILLPPTMPVTPAQLPTSSPPQNPAASQSVTQVSAVVLLLLGFGLGGVLTIGGGLVWLLFFRQHTPAATPVVPTPQPVQQSAGGGGRSKATTTSASPTDVSSSDFHDFNPADGVALVESWLEAKKAIFAPPYDLDLAANFLTGPAWTAVAKQDGSVDWLRKNNTYYRYGSAQVTLKRVLQSDAQRLVIDVYVQQPLRMYQNGRLRKSGIDQDTYRFDLRRVGDTWKIYDRRTVK
jgi:serine/threonine-protein kinase